jgi:hypothetical protein
MHRLQPPAGQRAFALANRTAALLCSERTGRRLLCKIRPSELPQRRAP